MKETIQKIVNKLSNDKISFADVRFTDTDEEIFYFERGELKEYGYSPNKTSLGIRVLYDGCWGFAGINEFDDISIDKAIKRAIENAKHGSLFKRQKVTFPPLKPVRVEYFQKPILDPFKMNREEKLKILFNIAKLLEGNNKIVFNFLYAVFNRQYKLYANTEGTFSEYTLYRSEPLMQVTASGNYGVQTRTFPGQMSGQAAGFEVIDQKLFEEQASKIIKEAIDLLDAPTIEEEKAHIIISADHLALQIHESIGHATEADRMFGMEISYAGKTFIEPNMIGSFRYASDIVNLVSDSSDPRGLGFHPVDDEGVPGKRVDIIKQGILVNMQTSRETAAALGLEPSSNMKAAHGYDFPLIRMTNLSLLPGDAGSLDDLIANTEKGYYLATTKTWSIDDNRRNFQFTTEIGYRIEDGTIKGIVKEPTYYGITPEFWNSCDAICSESEWSMHGTFDCGKGEPGQLMKLSHGAAPARFRNVVVNVKA